MPEKQTSTAKMIAPIIVTLVVVLFCGGYLTLLALARMPFLAFAAIGSVYILIIVCIIIALVQRIREIQGGEEDEAVHY